MLLFLVMAGSCGEAGKSEMPADGRLAAQWFYERGVALQVADEEGPEVCLRCFRAAARLLGAGNDVKNAPQRDEDALQDPRHLYALVQNASREVSLRDKARRVGGTMLISTEINDGVASMALKWMLGDDLRDVADFACCAGIFLSRALFFACLC